MNFPVRSLAMVAIAAATIPLSAQPVSPQTSVTGKAGGSKPEAAGPVIYARHCATCHGANGDGNGPASVWLYPRPRNFNAGLFKVQSTPAGFLPTDEDLLRSVTRGLPGSSMPSFSYLDESQRRAAVGYVKYLTAFTNAAGQRVNRFDEAQAAARVGTPVVVPSEPPVTVESLALGKAMFTKMQCLTCHGETGAGDGVQVPTLKDSFGLPARPRDFNTGLFRGGHTGRDLYLRINIGLAGTPMVPYGDDVLKPAERWALVHYVQSLRRTDVAVNDLLTPEDGSVHVRKVAKLPEGPMDPFWDSLDPVRVPLNPLWPEPKQVYAVAVSAVTDGKKLAMLLQWRDELPQNKAIRVQDFQDAAAIQFSLSGGYGFLGMGDAANPVNLWQWKAGWQAEANGDTPEMRDAYNSMHVDGWIPTNFVTAARADNVISQPHKSPIEDANARGFGSFKSQPLAQQNVQGNGVWHDGFWNVVFIRDLKSKDVDDVRIVAGKPLPVAFGIWNGEQGDRNGRKMISNWYQLILDAGKAKTTKR